MASLEIGTLLHERYKILEQIGRGGFGAVYRAKDQSLGRICAVKENLNDSDESSRQFHREASLLAGLNHLSLPRVTDHFRIDGQGQYLVMDFVEGQSLQQLLAEKKAPLSENDIATWMIQVTQALHYLHNRQPPIIHRDIKPANIIVNQKGRAILVDFGISKVVEGGEQTTMGARAITPGFSPPEQYGISSTDNRSDLYSLGATMYACITGKNPPESIQMMMGQATLPEPSSLNETISRPLNDVIRHAMVLAMGSRYQSAVEMEGALKEATTQPLPTRVEAIVNPVVYDEFAQTIDQPVTPALLSESSLENPISTAAPASNRLSVKNKLPIWAWSIIVVGGFLIVFFVALMVFSFYYPVEPVAEVGGSNESPIPNQSQPIEIDGAVINWRAGGNAYGRSADDLNKQRISNFAINHQTSEIYAVTADQIIVFDLFGNQIDSAEYSAAFSTQDITIGPDNNLYVLDKLAKENFIRVFSPELLFLREFGRRIDTDIEEENKIEGITAPPVNLVFGPDGLIWMLDYRLSKSQDSDKLFKMDPESGQIMQSVQLDTDYSSSDQLVMGADKKLYLLLGSESRIYEVNDQFEPVYEMTVPEASFVDSIGIGANGTLFAGVSQDNVFIQFDRNGELLKRFGARSEKSDIAYPMGLFYNIEKIELLDGNLFVLDESVTYSYVVSIFP